VVEDGELMKMPTPAENMHQAERYLNEVFRHELHMRNELANAVHANNSDTCSRCIEKANYHFSMLLSSGGSCRIALKQAAKCVEFKRRANIMGELLKMAKTCERLLETANKAFGTDGAFPPDPGVFRKEVDW